MINLDLDQNRIIVSFDPYSDASLAQVKEIGGAWWDRRRQAWRFPLIKLEPILASFPQHWKTPAFQKYFDRVELSNVLRVMEDAEQPFGVTLPLYRFQRVAVNFLASLKRCLLLSRGVGVGKSPVGIAWARQHIEAEGRRGVLVVTKAAGKYPYRAEILRAVPGAKVAIVEGEDGDFPNAEIASWCVVNWDIIHAREQQILSRKFSAVIFSESHKAKDSKTQRGMSAYAISRSIPRVLLETASFTPHRNAEAFSQLCILGLLDPKQDFWEYHKHFCDAKQIEIGRRKIKRWDFTGSTNSEDLHKAIAPFTYTIIREEVLPDLPKVRFTPVLSELSNAPTYRAAEKDFIGWLRETKGDEKAQKARKALAMTRMTALLELAARGNADPARDYIDTALDAGEKVLVFSSFKAPLHALKQHYGEVAVMITGDESAKEKDAAREAFQTSEAVRICLCSTEAGGESITLTAATAVIFLSLPWSPAAFSQAYGRSDRLGQTKSIQVVVLIGRQTIQIEQVERLYEKELNISMVVGGSDRSPNSEALASILAEVKGANAQYELAGVR